MFGLFLFTYMAKKKIKKIKNLKTSRVRKVIKKVVENRGKVSVSKAMKEAGFSDAYAKNPQQLIRTKTWQEIMETEFKDADIAKIHKKLLHAKGFTSRSFPKEMEDEDIEEIVRKAGANPIRVFEGKNEMGIKVKKCFFSYPKEVIIDKALDKIYKLKGRYSETIEITTSYRKLSNEELMEKIKELSKSLSKK